jgi:glycosyltransferase 2 family protein
VKKAIQFLASAGIGATILYLLFRSQNTAYQAQCRLDGVPTDQCSLFDKIWNDFSSVHLGWMAGVILAFTVSNFFRAIRWQMLHAPMGYQIGLGNSVLSILLGYFANLGLPRVGEVVRAGTLARYEGVPLEKVMGTMVVDRLMDFLCLGLVVGLAFVFQGNVLLDFIAQRQTGASSGGGLLSNPLVLGVLGMGALGLLLFFVFRKQLMQLPLAQKLMGMVGGFRDGLLSVLKLDRPVLFIALSLGIWLMFYLQCYFNLKAFAPTAHLGLAASLMVFVFGTLGFIIPSPGGMGTFHALCIAGLVLYNISGTDAFSYANIAFFSVQIFYNIVGGVLALVLLPMMNKSRKA